MTVGRHRTRTALLMGLSCALMPVAGAAQRRVTRRVLHELCRRTCESRVRRRDRDHPHDGLVVEEPGAPIFEAPSSLSPACAAPGAHARDLAQRFSDFVVFNPQAAGIDPAVA